MKQRWQGQKVHKQDLSHLLYIPTLAFLDYYVCTSLLNVDVFVECSMWETFRLFPSCHDGLGIMVWDGQFCFSRIITGYFCTPQKASAGTYDYPLQILFVPSLLHSSFYCFYTCFCSFFYVIYHCYLAWFAHNFCPA